MSIDFTKNIFLLKKYRLMEIEIPNLIEFNFKCGEMKVENGKVKPSPTKGFIKIYFNKDKLLCWQWCSEDLKVINEPIVIFSDEWEWNKIPTVKGRVYQLKSKCFEDYFIFWLQETDSTKDTQLEEDIKEILLSGQIKQPTTAKNKIVNSSNETNQKPLTNNPNNNNNNKNMMDVIDSILGKSKWEVYILYLFYNHFVNYSLMTREIPWFKKGSFCK